MISIAGRTSRELVDAFGSPLYVYDGATIRRQQKRLVDAFKGVDLRLLYACKANSNPAMTACRNATAIMTTKRRASGSEGRPFTTASSLARYNHMTARTEPSWI